MRRVAAVAIVPYDDSSTFINLPIARADFGFVNVAPAPVLSGLEGLDDRMAGGVKMFSGVTIRRRIATANVPAGET
jgi:hypothetical protein